MNTTMKKEELEKSLDRVNHWIIAVDQKISIAIAVIVGFLTLSIKPTSELLLASWQKISGIDVALLVIAMLLIVVGAFKLFLSISPRVRSKSKSLLYFGTISNLSLKQFKKSLANSKNSTYEIDLIEQIHTNSIIAKKKYSHYKDALLVILVAIFLWLLLITLITLEVLSDKT
jgi:hypothetical protein